MEAKELRIGNWISVEGEEIEVTDVMEHGINLIHDCWEYDLEDLEPIPLTEEWLLKFGFDEITPKYYVLNIDENISFTYYYTFSGGVWRFEFEGVYPKLFYVHELQNLIYSLTKKELPIKK